MAGSIIQGVGKARVIARVAAIKLQVSIDLVSDVELIAITAARWSRRIGADIRIDYGLGLLPQVINRKRKGQVAADCRSHAHLLTFLLGEQVGVR